MQEDPEGAYGQAVYRHEYGHSIDYSLAPKGLKKASDSKGFVSAMQADLDALLQPAPKTKDLTEEYASASKGQSVRDVTMNALDRAAKNEPAIAAIKGWIDEISDIPPGTIRDKKGVAISADRVQELFPNGIRTHLAQLVVAPDGNPRSPAAIYKALTALKKARDGMGIEDTLPNTLVISDTMGATTENKVGGGHSVEYLRKPGKAQAEVFANLTDMHAHSEGSRAIAAFMFPNQYREYQNILAANG